MSILIVEMKMPKNMCCDCEISIDGFACKKARTNGGKCPIIGVLPEDGFPGGVSNEIAKAWERYLESERAAEKIAAEEDLNRRRRELETIKAERKGDADN